MSIQHEKEYFDSAYESGVRDPAVKFYSIVRSTAFYRDFLRAHCRDKKVLEYGCGTGSYSFYLVSQGPKVIGIDISGIAIRMAESQEGF